MTTDDPIEVPVAFQEAMAKVDAAKPSQADICDALPEECAVEVTGVRGEKRIDYKKVPIRNADGSLNRYGKNLIELHEPAAKAGSDIVDRMQAGDLEDRPEQEHKRPLDPEIARRVAEHRGLVAVPGNVCRGRSVRDETGQPNLWLNRTTGRLYRMALVGTEHSARVETYLA